MSIKSTMDAIGLIATYSQRNQGNAWWRGQSNKDDKLKPGVFRADRGFRYEVNVCNRFRAFAHSRHGVLPTENDYSGWLYLMQHYGLPTRLLDWTESPLIALYFAVEKEDELSGALWGLNPYLLNKNQKGSEVIYSVNNSTVLSMFEKAFNDKVISNNKVLPIMANEIDQRMMVQLSRFLIFDIDVALEDISKSDEFIYKIDIPSDVKSLIRRELMWLGVRRSNLFPDLHNLAIEISQEKFSKSSMPVV